MEQEYEEVLISIIPAVSRCHGDNAVDSSCWCSCHNTFAVGLCIFSVQVQRGNDHSPFK